MGLGCMGFVCGFSILSFCFLFVILCIGWVEVVGWWDGWLFVVLHLVFLFNATVVCGVCEVLLRVLFFICGCIVVLCMDVAHLMFIFVFGLWIRVFVVVLVWGLAWGGVWSML